LLPQVMAKQIAARAGAHEAWMTDGDRVTEGASSTAFIITPDRRLITRPLSNAVLPGITRVSILALAREHGLTLEERIFTVAEAQQAAEAFYTSASTFVMPVVSIDGVQIGNGQPGPLTQALRTLYLRFAGVDVAEPVDQM
jgi:D-alanine transaminase